MENLRALGESIRDIGLKKIAMREISIIEDAANKWAKRAKDMSQKGWCFIEDRRELYDLVLKETEDVQRDIFYVDFWVERWGDGGFPQKLFALNKQLIQSKNRIIKLTRFFVMSKETFSKDKVKEIIRLQRRELSTDHNKADLVVLLRNEFRQEQPEVCKSLQNMVIFDESMVLVELSDQFGETTGIGPVIGKDVTVTEQEKREMGILGGTSKYLELAYILQELSTKKSSYLLRII